MVDFRAGARLLMDGASALSDATTPAARIAAADEIVQGSAFVRALADNPHQARMADTIASHAYAAAAGRNVERSIGSAMDGAGLLLQSIRARGL